VGKLKGLLVIGLAVVIVVAVGGGIVFAQGLHKGPPPPPPWVNPDGTTDLAKLPDKVPVGDRTGRIIGYVDKTDAFGPPPEPTAPGVPSRSHPTPVKNERGEVIGYLGPSGFVPQ
jgi:hypothetical protein